tara:strand:- start:1696 stop:2874 length:1179 start_codon:yes stop_codon:yes gene_type:complete
VSFSNDIVLLYGPTWDHPAQLSKHHFTRLWSKERRVLYIESPPNLLSFFTRRKEFIKLLRRGKKGPKQLIKNVWVTTFLYFLPFRGSKYIFGSEIINKINQYFIRKKLLRYINDLDLKNPIIFISSANAVPLLKTFPNSLKIYHCSDDYTVISAFPESFKNIEKKLIKSCDLVVTTADELLKSKSRHAKDIISIPNGANISHFSKVQNNELLIKDEIAGFKKPIVGYVGSIFQWLDLEWIAFAAHKLSNYNFIFIGPITIDISSLENFDNIHFIGPRDYEEIPSYIKAFDVAVIPFVIDEVTLKASPIKFYEYLASGIPIVSTKLPDLEGFKDLVYLAENKEEYVEFLNSAIQNDNVELQKKRMDVSLRFSWENRFDTLNEKIKDILKQRKF